MNYVTGSPPAQLRHGTSARGGDVLIGAESVESSADT
jgi:hypothetical protein